MKSLITIAGALLLAVAFAVPAYAEDGAGGKGKKGRCKGGKAFAKPEQSLLDVTTRRSALEQELQDVLARIQALRDLTEVLAADPERRCTSCSGIYGVTPSASITVLSVRDSTASIVS